VAKEKQEKSLRLIHAIEVKRRPMKSILKKVRVSLFTCLPLVLSSGTSKGEVAGQMGIGVGTAVRGIAVRVNINSDGKPNSIPGRR
jgi:hypothetical protein